MNDEKRQRQMDFILNQQVNHESRRCNLENLTTRLANISLEKFESLEGKVDVLIDSQIRTEKALTTLIDTTNQVLNALAENHNSTQTNGSMP